jgi:arsenite methyltransferase
LKTESAVKERYAAGALAQEAALCCPVDYDAKYLEIIPQEVIEKDYGCGDPSKHVRPGETVLDLGSGTGKICFIASQVVGAAGKVIGIDMTDAMLEVARRNAPIVAERIGYANVEFRKGRIQDLALDVTALEEELKKHPVSDANGFLGMQHLADTLRRQHPLVADDSIDVVVSNCVLNLVDNGEKASMFRELHRVLKKGGRAVISDIVCDEDVPEEMQLNEELWSGCISGAFREDAFLQAFEDAGFYGVRILSFDKTPWQTVNGIEFRSMTVEAFKGKEGPCVERNQAIIYKGPFKSVVDDDGHLMERGKRYATCDKTYQIYQRAPYAEHFEFVGPLEEIPLETAGPFDCSRTVLRDPRETKGMNYSATIESTGPNGGSTGTCCGDVPCCS